MSRAGNKVQETLRFPSNTSISHEQLDNYLNLRASEPAVNFGDEEFPSVLWPNQHPSDEEAKAQRPYASYIYFAGAVCLVLLAAGAFFSHAKLTQASAQPKPVIKPVSTEPAPVEAAFTPGWPAVELPLADEKLRAANESSLADDLGWSETVDQYKLLAEQKPVTQDKQKQAENLQLLNR